MPSYDFGDLLGKLVSWRAPARNSPPPPPPPQCLLPLARSLWRAVESCVPIAWLHHLAPPGEHQLTSLVRASGLQLPQRGGAATQATQAEWRAFAACGRRPPQQRLVFAESWREVVADALDSWWRKAHGAHCPQDLRFALAREHCLRGLPRVPRGGGAGELLELPISSGLPLAARGVSAEWVSAFFVWMSTRSLFRIPTRVFVEAFVPRLCGKQPPRRFGQGCVTPAEAVTPSALPRLASARSSAGRPPVSATASANWQMCPGQPAKPALLSM